MKQLLRRALVGLGIGRLRKVKENPPEALLQPAHGLSGACVSLLQRARKTLGAARPAILG